jgi:gliding motility-associated-like protein
LLNIKNIFLNIVQSRFTAGNKSFYILFLIFASAFCNAQTNLVYNGDFELYDSCPQHESYPGNIEINKCVGWTTPTYATSDYFNTCALGNNVGVPTNMVGYQMPKSGNSYCGFYAYNLSSGIWWEYIQGELLFNLNTGKRYKLSCFLNLAEDSYYTIDQIGILLSDNSINDYSSTLPLNEIPQFTTPIGVQINDTANWMYFEWYFIANGNERSITIGNFNGPGNSDTMLHDANATEGNSYIYIDNVSITDASDGFENANIFSPNGDGINDLWYPPFPGTYDFEIKLFNRWGTLIASSTKGFKWDGRNSAGIECCDGTYFYILSNKNNKILKGFIQLVR